MVTTGTAGWSTPRWPLRSIGAGGRGTEVLLLACAILLALAAGGLVATGVVSWRRTAALRRALARHGRDGPGRGGRHGPDGPGGRNREPRSAVAGTGPRAPGVSGRWRTSPTTFLAALAGVAFGLGGPALALSGRGPPRLGRPIGVLGACIALGGLAARVTALEMDRAGLVVRYRLRRPYVLPWKACTAVRPPRWPLGGWRLLGATGGRTLMPSDLLGLEFVLSILVERAGLAGPATPPRASPNDRHRGAGPGVRRGPGRDASRPPPPRPGP